MVRTVLDRYVNRPKAVEIKKWRRKSSRALCKYILWPINGTNMKKSKASLINNFFKRQRYTRFYAASRKASLLARQSSHRRVAILPNVSIPRKIRAIINNAEKYVIHFGKQECLSFDGVRRQNIFVWPTVMRFENAVTRDCGGYILCWTFLVRSSWNGTYEGDFGMHPGGAEHPIFHVLQCNRNCSPHVDKFAEKGTCNRLPSSPEWRPVIQFSRE